MPNPFNSGNTDPITNTEYKTDTRNTTVIKYTNSPTYTPTLLPGELAYNYMSGTMFIGALNPSDSPKTLIANNNSFQNFLTTDINLNVSNKVPTSRSVRLELDKKADLTHSNQFVGMNEFPYLRIRDAAPAQLDIAVTIRMLEDYLVALGIDPSSTVARRKTYHFSVPLMEWVIDHNENTTAINVQVIDINGVENFAPVTYVTVNNLNNTITINFTTPVAGDAYLVIYG